MRTAPLQRLAVAALLVLGPLSWSAEPEATDLPELKGEAKARIQNLEQRLQDWDVEGAAAELAELERIAPADVEPVRYFRGRIAFEEGRYDVAVQELEKSGVRDRPGSWVRLVKDTRAIVAEHVKFESEHFTLLTPKGKDELLAPWALEALEKARAGLKRELNYAPAGKVRVEIVSSAGELSKTSTLTREAIKTTGTIAICKFNKLIVTSPKAVVRGYDWLDTLAHEYTHLVVSKKSRNTVPIWMHEGLAKYLESCWRGPPGLAISPSTLALLGSRVRASTLVPFEKMHPSMALLPTAEDAATAFAEVFFALKLVHETGGPDGLARLLDEMAKGRTDRQAVETVTHRRWPDFEKEWMASLKKQPYPKELIPLSGHEKKELAENQSSKKKDTGRDINFGDFVEVQETDARRHAHLGELFRERSRMSAAASQYETAWRQVGDRYESVSNKYALTLLELGRLDDAARVLEGSLTMHPGSAQTNVHLCRLALEKRDWPKLRAAALEALAVDPFNPEIHVALYQAAAALGDASLEERATVALALLFEVPRTAVPEALAKLAARTSAPTTAHHAGRDGGAHDAGAAP